MPLTHTTEQLNIQVGDICIAFRYSDANVLAWLQDAYREFLCDLSADIVVEMTTTETMDLDEVRRRLCNSRLHHRDGEFSFEGGLVSGNYDLREMTIRLCLEKQLLQQNLASYYMNQLMCLFYYSAILNRQEASTTGMIHSSAVIIDDCGFLFTGPSGIGKTTAARLAGDCGNAVIINDEGNLLVKMPQKRDGFQIQGIPIIGKLPEKHNLKASLTSILFLKQGNSTVVRRMERTTAIKKLLYQVIGDQYFGQNNIGEIIASKMSFSDEISRYTPCYELEFTLNGDELYRQLISLKQSLKKEQAVYAP